MNIHASWLGNADHTETGCPANLRVADWDDRSGVILTSYRLERRLDRLGTVYNAIEQFAPNTAQKIGRLHDHKGFLSVYWVVQPDFKDRRLCEIAWGSSIAREFEEHVEHIFYKACVL